MYYFLSFIVIILVKIKWGKENLLLEIDPNDGMIMFKAQLMALSSVPCERQKLLIKGKQIKEDEDLLKLKNGDLIMMMGTADVLQDNASKPIVFMEDLTDAQKSQLVTNVLPCGLVNLGNTCYMNSGLQCLRSFPEVKEALTKYKPVNLNQNDPSASLVVSMNELYKLMDQSSAENPVTPGIFTMLFRQVFPEFAERSNNGAYMQQDADESFGQLQQLLLTKLKGIKVGDQSFESLFEGQLTGVTKCIESEIEPLVNSSESFKKLSCHITGNTNHLMDGIKEAMSVNVERNSSVLSRNANFVTSLTISKLPKYLTFQFVRFDWKRLENVKSKILRKVIFPINLDMFEYCDANLQAELKKSRELKLKQDEIRLGLKSLSKADSNSMDVDSSSSNSKIFTGRYELVALITHQGRTADSGHYIGWARREKDPSKWAKFDDATVTEVTEDDVKNLTGGGDWHMGYLCFYRQILE